MAYIQPIIYFLFSFDASAIAQHKFQRNEPVLSDSRSTLCSNARNTIKVIPISSEDVNAFNVFLSFYLFTAFAGLACPEHLSKGISFRLTLLELRFLFNIILSIYTLSNGFIQDFSSVLATLVYLNVEWKLLWLNIFWIIKRLLCCSLLLL